MVFLIHEKKMSFSSSTGHISKLHCVQTNLSYRRVTKNITSIIMNELELQNHIKSPYISNKMMHYEMKLITML